MAENRLQQNFKCFLPLNRKERFFTGTVLPQIICYNNFTNFSRFIKLIPGFPKNIEIRPDAECNNIQFLTEYSLKESLIDETIHQRFINPPDRKDTPDLVVLITEPELILIVIEAKMYSSIDIGKMNEQMKFQEDQIILSIKKTLGIQQSNIYHLCLIPKEMFVSTEGINYNIIFWEDIYEAFAPLMPGNYFLHVLKFALENFNKLASQSKGVFDTYGKNMETRLTGEQIIEMHNKGERFFVGRNYGLHGAKMLQDKISGGWKTYAYEVNLSAEKPANQNWFSSYDFVRFITGNASVISGVDNTVNPDYLNRKQNLMDNKSNINQDPWHFSHLGGDYFLNIASQCGLGRSWDAIIDKIYIGKSGVPYAEKRKGRNVNPNWCLVTLDGREFMGGPSKGGRVERGLWNLSSCKRFLWEDIKDFFCSQNKLV